MSEKKQKKPQVACYFPKINGEDDPIWSDIYAIARERRWSKSQVATEAARIGIKLMKECVV